MAPHWIWIVSLFAFGACVGSFLNVVVYRVPAGKSLVTPPSSDPVTGDKLKWWENIPIISWVMLRGRSRYSGGRISVQYPLVELGTALLWVAVYVCWYMTPGRPAFVDGGLAETWPVLLVTLFLMSALVAATVIDAKLYIIPLRLPWSSALVSLAALPAAVHFEKPPLWFAEAVAMSQPFVPIAGPLGVGAAAGGVLGLIVAIVLLHVGVLPMSFADETTELTSNKSQVTGGEGSPSDGEPSRSDPVASGVGPTADRVDPEAWLAHPHPRREVMKELLFVSLPLLGLLAGMLLAASWWGSPADGSLAEPMALPGWVRVLGGSVCGLVVGGGVIWLTRILGTLMFGKEAMGLGDVHLLAGIGAVVGPIDVMLIFLVAPFFGLTISLGAMIAASVKGERVRVVPYGPFLAAAAAAVILLGRDRVDLFGIFGG
jgi:leader peptidase (prepilin peptidase)/N-methyltransferase